MSEAEMSQEQAGSKIMAAAIAAAQKQMERDQKERDAAKDKGKD